MRSFKQFVTEYHANLTPARHTYLGSQAAHAQIADPNSSGQGSYKKGHHLNTHHDTLLKHGFEYSHSTPVGTTDKVYTGGGKYEQLYHIHHTYRHPVSGRHVGLSPKGDGLNWKWFSSTSGSGQHLVGHESAALDKHLKRVFK